MWCTRVHLGQNERSEKNGEEKNGRKKMRKPIGPITLTLRRRSGGQPIVLCGCTSLDPSADYMYFTVTHDQGQRSEFQTDTLLSWRLD